ncbi:MAG TPA: PfkB family carbohydrate kinase [Ignavibacteria bacterium]|nr:PfkB family carbohydrate kinase [Ignavibacteria bacterium]
MSLLVVGTVAFDTIETPFGKADMAIGGSGTYISLSASYFTDKINLVSIIGNDFPQEELNLMQSKGINTSGIEQIKDMKSFYWHGKYHFDMNTRDSLVTDLNVLAVFNPNIPQNFKNADYLCLGNIDPTIQMSIINQVDKPNLIMCDTMNFWIETKNKELIETLKKVDILLINDSEARELTNEYNLVTAARKIFTMGPKIVVIKKGENGALLFHGDSIFFAPAYPLEKVFDPTGAGDTFAGGFMGWIAKTNDFSTENVKLAMIYGSAMASLVVEDFSINKLRNLTENIISERFDKFKGLVSF